MSKDLNKVTLIGRLGKDPELRYTGSGKAVVNMTLATSEKYTSQGEAQEHTEWHRLVVWDKLAEICSKYLQKGSHIYIEGAIRTRKWQDNEGQDRYSTEIRVSDMIMLGSTGDRGSQGSSGASSQRPEPAAAGGGGDDGFDDIPFAQIDPKLP